MIPDVSRETEAKLRNFEAIVREESQKQNLISASTLESFWDRHILDSLQLMSWIAPGKTVADIGSGAGLPGIVLAIAGARPVILVEPRRLRAEFLQRVARELGLDVEIIPKKVEAVNGSFDIITGRALAPVDRFLALTEHLSHKRTIWLLPKGRNAQSELEQARRSWQCEVGEEPSCTDPESTILIVSKVRRK